MPYGYVCLSVMNDYMLIIETTLVSFTGEIPCECSEHTGRTLLNEIYNGEVETIFQLLFTDSDFYKSFLKSRNTTSKERLQLLCS